MLKYTVGDRGWVAHINENILDLGLDNVIEICNLIYEHHVIVFRNQNLKQEEQLNFCSMFGDVNNVYGHNEGSKHISYENGIIRVTGELNEHGKEGLFGHAHTLDWHTHQPSTYDRFPFIWMYTHKGSKGSRTSWMNMRKAYEDLDPSAKDEIENIKIICGYEKGRFSTTEFFKELIYHDRPINIIQKNSRGDKGLYLPYLQIFGVDEETYDKNEWKFLFDELVDHMTQDKYIFHHDWEDGDVIISEQWHTLHKRWEFKDIKNRMLHRIAFNDLKVNYE